MTNRREPSFRPIMSITGARGSMVKLIDVTSRWNRFFSPPHHRDLTRLQRSISRSTRRSDLGIVGERRTREYSISDSCVVWKYNFVLDIDWTETLYLGAVEIRAACESCVSAVTLWLSSFYKLWKGNSSEAGMIPGWPTISYCYSRNARLRSTETVENIGEYYFDRAANFSRIVRRVLSFSTRFSLEILI